MYSKKGTKNNITITFFCDNENDHIFKYFKQTHNNLLFYENKLLEKIKSLNLNGTYIDCGSNIGNHSVFFLNFTNCNNLVSIEGHPKIYETLQKNLVNNNSLKKSYVTLNNLIGNENNDNYYIYLDDKNNCGVGTVNNKKIGDNVKMITLDSLTFKHKISLIKIDVENYEYFVLMGALNIIKLHKPVIVIELHTTNPYYDNIIKILNDLNYVTDGINYASSPTFIYTFKI